MRVRYGEFEMPALFDPAWLQGWGQGEELALSRGGAPLSLLVGPGEVFYLSHIWQSEVVFEEGLRVHLLDCAIRFNAFMLAEEAFRRGEAAEYILHRVTVQRAFTPYQILDALRETLEALSAPGPGVEERTVPFILAPCKQFFDGDVAEDEGAFLLKKMLGLFGEFKRRGVPLVVVEKRSYRSALFPKVLGKIAELSTSHWGLEERGQQGKVPDGVYRLTDYKARSREPLGISR